MRRRLAPRLLAALAIGSLCHACSRRSERRSEVAVAPGGRWKRAYVTLSYGPAFYQNGHHSPAGVIHGLFIDGDGYNRAQVVLAQVFEGTVPTEQFRAMRETTYSLRFAPDSHAFAVSADGGRAWTVFDLEVLSNPTGQPFWCGHRSFASLDPWPASRALALEILAAADPSSPFAGVHRSRAAPVGLVSQRNRRGTLSWHDELAGASHYACVRRNDPELRAAVIDAFLRSGNEFADLEVRGCLGDMTRGDPAVRLRLQTALATADLATRSNIEGALWYADHGPPAAAH